MTKIFILVLGLLIENNVYPAELFGMVDALTGEVSVTDISGSTKPAILGQKIYSGQTIQTADDAEVHVATEDSGLIALRPNSNFRIDHYQAKGEDSDESVFSLFKGAVRSITGWIAKRNTSAYRLQTATVTIGVRGTDHETTIVESATNDLMPGTYDTVNEGTTVLKSNLGETEVRPGQFAFASHEGNAAPRLLAKHPFFNSIHPLKLENRIQQRKEVLRQHVQHTLKDRFGDLGDNGDGRNAENIDSRPAAAKKIIKHRRPPRERRIP